MGKLIVSYLLSPIGLSMGRKDSQRTDILNIANRVRTTYITVIIILLSRSVRIRLSYVFLINLF